MGGRRTAVLGAGMAGLAAAYRLVQRGICPIVIERDAFPGGLARAIRHKEFSVDLGRKEMLDRVPEVLEFRQELLGDDYSRYERRCGILYKNNIYETERRYGGWMHGMSLPLAMRCGLDAMLRFVVHRRTPESLEQQRYAKLGRQIARVFYQAYEEKLSGIRWADSPALDDPAAQPSNQAPDRGRHLLGRLIQSGHTERIWRHPRYGMGQICDALTKRCVDGGAEMHFLSSIKSITARDKHVDRIEFDNHNGGSVIETDNVISSLPLEFSASLLGAGNFPKSNADGSAQLRRHTILVYLFLERPPLFPHNWLKITCPDLRAARVTNYAAYSADMVPAECGCLCVEYCSLADDPLVASSDAHMFELALKECTSARLIHPDSVEEHSILRLPGTDGATDLSDWWTPNRCALLEDLRRYRNFFHVTIPGTDLATYSGLLAAEAIITSDRSTFDSLAGPLMSERYADE